MFTLESVTNLTTIDPTEITVSTSSKIIATIKRDDLLVCDLQKILKEIPGQYKIGSLRFYSDKDVHDDAINVTCVEIDVIHNKVTKEDNTIPTPRNPVFDNIVPCSNDTSSVPEGYRREEGMTVSVRTRI